jgi:hypothetical protein
MYQVSILGGEYSRFVDGAKQAKDTYQALTVQPKGPLGLFVRELEEAGDTSGGSGGKKSDTLYKLLQEPINHLLALSEALKSLFWATSRTSVDYDALLNACAMINALGKVSI